MRDFSASHLDDLESLNSMFQFVYYMCEHCNRNGRVQLEKHGATVNEIKNSEKLYDSVRKEANQLLDMAKLASGKCPTFFGFSKYSAKFLNINDISRKR